MFGAACSASLVLGACAGPPVQALSNARQALIAARQADAERYAPGSYAEAERWLDDAEFALHGNDYGRARSSALRALEAARAAATQARRLKAAAPPVPATSSAPAGTSVPPAAARSSGGHNRALG